MAGVLERIVSVWTCRDTLVRTVDSARARVAMAPLRVEARRIQSVVPSLVTHRLAFSRVICGADMAKGGFFKICAICESECGQARD